MGILILHDNQYCHINPFQPVSFSSSGADLYQHPQDQLSVLLNGVCFIRLQVSFVLPTLPPLFLQGLRFLNQVSILFMCSLFILFLSMFVSGDSHEDSNGASSSSFFILLFFGGFNSSFLDHIPFLVLNVVSCRCTP